MRLKQLFILTTISILLFTSCKKEPKCVPDTGEKTRADLTRDSIFLYAKDIYLWNTALPSYDAFNPKKYTSLDTDLKNYEAELIGLAKSAVNPVTGKGYEMNTANTDTKYSYITDIADKNPTAFIPNKISAVDLEGNGNDFGMKLGIYLQGEAVNGKQEFVLYVTAVYQNSPADKAGIIRSHKILKINDRTIGASLTADEAFINASINASTIKLEGVTHLNGISDAPFTATLTKASYNSSPVYAAKVFTTGAKKVGYLAYARFSSISNSKQVLDEAFSKFATDGVTELIVDLRYNGGGYVNTAEYLINQIAPSSLNEQIMFSEHYNPLMQSGGATILKNQPVLDGSGKILYASNGTMLNMHDNIDYSVAGNTSKFKKNGGLSGVTKVVFIVSGNTASASELLISCLKPHINVKIVGRQTYGKPVGFFPIRIENKYDVYYSLFHIKNSLGDGDYFNGFAPNVSFGSDPRGSLDDPRNNFGDPDEYYTSVALKELGAANPVTTATNKTMSINGKSVSVQSLAPMKQIVDGNEFVGMIETRHKIKK